MLLAHKSIKIIIISRPPFGPDDPPSPIVNKHSTGLAVEIPLIRWHFSITWNYSGRYFANFEFCEMRNQISDLLRNLRNCEIAIFEKSSCLNRLFLCVIACSPHLAHRLAVFGGLQSTGADFLVAHSSKIELSAEKLVKIGNHWPKIGQK